MTYRNRVLKKIHWLVSRLLVTLHAIAYKEDEMHYTTKFRAGKRCVNVCSYCGSDNTTKTGVYMPVTRKTVCNPIYINNISGSEFTAYPQVIESEDFLTHRDDTNMPIVCMNCGRAYSSSLVIKTLDIIVVLYY